MKNRALAGTVVLGAIVVAGGLALAADPPATAKKAANVEYYGGSGALPFSPAVRVGNTLYLSGQIGAVPGAKTMTLAPGGITGEARQAMENIRATLEQHGSSLENVVKCTVFLADIKDWPAFNEVYRGFFKSHFPARSALAASGLAYNARTEVECIAVIP
jgi:2-iminobutanoate/2-iminopropanoate deaminase